MNRAMLAATVIAWTGSFLLGPLHADDDGKPSAEALKLLAGQWEAQEFSRSGTTGDVSDEKVTLQIVGARWIVQGREKSEVVAIDLKADPIRLDLKSLEAARAGRVDEGRVVHQPAATNYHPLPTCGEGRGRR